MSAMQGESATADLGFLQGAGEMGALMRAYDWTGTSLGPISGWPQSLRTAVGIVLRSPVPMVLLWGPDGIMIYNDAYSVFAASRHPHLLGSKVREGWPEVADFNDNVMRVGLSGGTLSYRDQELTLYRKGVPEQVWMNLDYSPVLDESGQPVGVLAVVVETTERVRTEQALAKAQERLSYALNAGGMVGTFDWHIPSDTFYSDARFASLFSVDPEKGEKGTSIADYVAGIHPDDVDRILKAVEHTIATGEKYFQEYRLLQRDGTIRWIEARGECLYDKDGKPLRFPGVVVDITDRKRNEEALRTSEERLHAIFAQTTGGIAQVDLIGCFELVNQRFCDIVGYSEAELLGMRMQDITHPDDRPGNLALFKGLVETGANFVIEKRYVRKDGSPVWVNNSVAGIRDATGRTQHVVAMVIDITEGKRAQEALRESQRDLKAVLDNATVAIFRMDDRQHCVYMNTAAERLTGFTLDEVRGRPLHDVIHHTRPDGGHYPLEECPIDRAFPDDHQMQGEEVFVHKDGHLYPVAFTASPIRDENGKPIGTIIEVRDIRAEKEAQERQRLLLREMNHRVKNLFAIMGGMVSLSARSASSPQEMAQSLRGRIDALVRSNDLIRPGIVDAETPPPQSATLDVLIRTVLSPYVDEGGADERLALDGPAVPIGARAVTSLALALHETATNAAKYGALSAPEGRIRIDWTARTDTLLLLWEETGGPAIATPPAVRGFGSFLAQRSVAGQLGGEIAYDWRPEGVRIRMTIPLESLGR